MELPFPMYVIRIGQVWKLTWSGLRRNAPKQNQENTGFSGPDLDFPVALSSNFGNVALTCMHQFHSIPPLYLKKTYCLNLPYIHDHVFVQKQMLKLWATSSSNSSKWKTGELKLLGSGIHMDMADLRLWCPAQKTITLQCSETWDWEISPQTDVSNWMGKSSNCFSIFLQQTIFAAASRLFLIKECALAARQPAFCAWKWKWNKNHSW